MRSPPALAQGTRLTYLRIGIVLAKQGGALHAMLTPFKLGLGGPVGNGRQYMSWIALEDLVGAIEFLFEHPEIEGPVNGTAPEPVIQREFAKALGRVLHRPAFLPLPAFAARLILGREAADDLLLTSLARHAG